MPADTKPPKAAPPQAPRTTNTPQASMDEAVRALEEAQQRVDDLELERTVRIPRREYERRDELLAAQTRHDMAAIQRLKDEKFELNRRNNAILQVEQPRAEEALRQARQRHLDAQLDLPTGTPDELEEALAAAQQARQALVHEQQQLEGRVQRALRLGDIKTGSTSLARKAALPFELAAADVQVRRASAALAQAQVAEAEAELPALREAVEVAEAKVREANEARNRAVSAWRGQLQNKQEAESTLRQHRKTFGAELAGSE